MGHLSERQYEVYTAYAHEVIARQAGRDSLAEEWLRPEHEAPPTLRAVGGRASPRREHGTTLARTAR
jgi:hypothetical protein